MKNIGAIGLLLTVVGVFGFGWYVMVQDGGVGAPSCQGPNIQDCPGCGAYVPCCTAKSECGCPRNGIVRECLTKGE